MIRYTVYLDSAVKRERDREGGGGKTYKVCGGVPTLICPYHCRSVFPRIQLVRGMVTGFDRGLGPPLRPCLSRKGIVARTRFTAWKKADRRNKRRVMMDVVRSVQVEIQVVLA